MSTTRKELERQIKIAEEALRRAKLELTKVDRPATPGNHNLIARWSKKFPNSWTTYNYAAVAANAYWYTTGTGDVNKLGWKDLLDTVEADADSEITLVVNGFSSGEIVTAWRYSKANGWKKVNAGNELQNAPVPF